MKFDLRLTLHYGLTIFLSAFLLFQVQPMIGKMILPWFGGSASVWTTCMLFFQMILLLGYLYSHWVVARLSPRRQSQLHIVLLLASLLVIPIAPSDAWKPTGAENPTLRILGLLLASIGLPYFVLSTTGPLVQAWFARERSGHIPYRLFALSNFGSMLALIAYPLAIEPVLPTRLQSWAWSGLFATFVISCGLLAWRGRNSQPIVIQHHDEVPPISGRQLILWAALAACPSILMVADTSFLTENIAPIPLLWVAPLGLYLLSFILAFEGRGWYRRSIYLPLLVVGLGALAWLPTLGVSELSIQVSMAINLASFFVACMVCHGELSRHQPHPGQLTTYYLMLAVGGALGGFFVGVIAPYFFNSHYELSIAIVLTGLVAAIAVIPTLPATRPGWRLAAGAGCVVVLVALAGVRVADHVGENSGADALLRNFYGTLTVHSNPETGFRTMLHGQIVHGRQFIAADKAQTPIAYYSSEGGAGKALLAKAGSGPLRVGVVGIGIGTLAAYGRAGDYYRLYDIDPLVIDVARSHFSFLAQTRAQTDIVLGDARLQLETERPQLFDVLIVDAFSGDSVPVHLLTRQAFELYFRHLKPDGVLAVHITNRFLDLRPVIKAAADHLQRPARIVDHDGDRERGIYRSRWALIAQDDTFYCHEGFEDAKLLADKPGFRPWQDDYSSLFAILM
ncbi:MAG TPA: fused MFS/spermidine synthase [Azonexus sp.]|jgi:SAM-dependent methyltransferase|nr:fused MFS/spermidine synthase [Azonexus sp.]